jgi:hypothetical protein
MRMISFATQESDWQSPRMGIILHTDGRDSRHRLDCEKMFAPADRPSNCSLGRGRGPSSGIRGQPRTCPVPAPGVSGPPKIIAPPLACVHVRTVSVTISHCPTLVGPVHRRPRLRWPPRRQTAGPRPGVTRSCLHGHSALSRASSRHSGGTGLLRAVTLIPDTAQPISLVRRAVPGSPDFASRRTGPWVLVVGRTVSSRCSRGRVD